MSGRATSSRWPTITTTSTCGTVDYQPWNSVNMGPEQNIVGRWGRDVRQIRASLRCQRPRLAHMDVDGGCAGLRRQADGRGRQRHMVGRLRSAGPLRTAPTARSVGSENVGTIHSQWEWGKRGVTNPTRHTSTSSTTAR